MTLDDLDPTTPIVLCLRAIDAQRQAEMDAYDKAHPAPDSER